MPQPAANDKAAERLIDAYREAHTQMLAAYEEALADPRRVRQTARLRELLRTNEAVMDGLVDASRAWWGATLPELHAAGAAQAASVVGSAFTWTRPHVDAVNEYVTHTWSDVAAKLTDIRAETRAALRREIQAGTRSVLLESKTAAQAARELAKAVAREGLWSVRYSNGARHTMADYFDSVIRWTTGEAYNRGSVAQTVADGFTHVEYFDGEDCGVESHDDPRKANGLIVPVEEVVYLSHPRCRRAIVPATESGPLTSGTDIGEPRGVEPAPLATRPPRKARTPRAGRAPVTIEDLAGQMAADAESAAIALQDVLERVVAGAGELVGTENRIKSAEGIARKLADDLAGLPLSTIDAAAAASRVPDAIRFTVVFDEAGYVAGSERTLDQLLAEGYTVDRLKNFWSDPSGYQGINAVLLSPDGVRFELQLHTAVSYRVKEELTHALYEEWRVTPPGTPRALELREAMDALFATVPVPDRAGTVGS